MTHSTDIRRDTEELIVSLEAAHIELDRVLYYGIEHIREEQFTELEHLVGSMAEALEDNRRARPLT
jgi:hypothetical protein